MTTIDDPFARLVRAGGSVVLATQELALDSLAFACYCSGMTDTTFPSFPSDLLDVPMEQLIEEASELGASAGRAQGSWMTVDSESGARRLLALDEAGDPVLHDSYGPRAPLSGEYSDDLTPLRLIRDEMDLDPDSVTPEEEQEICSAFEDAYYQGYWDDVLGRARSFVADCDRERESELLAVEADLD